MKVDIIPAALDATSKGRRSGLDRIVKLGSQYGIFVFLLVLIIASSVIAPSFLSGQNLSNLVLETVPLAIVTVGQALVIMTGGLDLSVASVMATAAVVGTSFSGLPIDVVAIIAVAILIGAITGLVNGLLVTKRQVSPFLATLASMTVLQGLRFAWTKGAPSGGMPHLLRVVGSVSWHGIPVNLAVLAVSAVIVGIVVHRTILGRRFMIVGGNRVTGSTSRLSGGCHRHRRLYRVRRPRRHRRASCLAATPR